MNMRKQTWKAAVSAAAICVAAALPSWAADGTWVGGTSMDLCEPLNWSDGVLPTDNASISLSSAGTLTCSGTFSPKSITFPSGSAKVTIGGEGSITGILAITNEVSQHHVFNLPVTFAEGVEAIISVDSSNYMDFAGGMTAYTIKNNGTVYYSSLDVYLAYYCGKITLLKEYEDWSVTDYKKDFIYVTERNTVLTLPGAENSGKANFTVRNGATLLVNGDFRMTRNDHNIQNCIVFRIEGSTPGTVKVTGKVVSSNKAQAAPFCYGTNGKFVVGGLEHGSSFVFMLNGFGNQYSAAQAKNSSTCYWWIGSGGITGNNGTESGVTTYAFHTLSHANAQAHFTATEDFPINAVIALGGNSTLAFNTTDPETGEGHTVTANAVLWNGGKVTVAGVGKFLFNSVSTFSNGLIVNDSATVAVNAGKKPGNGAVTMNGTSTLKVAQSGTVTLGGNLTLGSTATLAFNFTDKATAPQLVIPAASTIPETVNVKISADEGIWPFSSRTHTLTSTYDFTGKTVNLVDKPKWVKSVNVVGGNIVLKANPKGLMVFVK